MTTTNVLITGDTHLTSGAKLPLALLQLADRADHILHTGDVTDSDVLDVLEALAPVEAVRGNCDGLELVDRCPHWLVTTIASAHIGMVHDAGPQAGRHVRLRERFGPEISIAIYGHTHMPETTRSHDGLLVINPGSPTQRRRAPFHSAVWLEITDSTIAEASLVNLDDI